MSGSPANSVITDAINAALAQKWDDAIRLNLQILEDDSNNLDAYNRLGFAYTQTGNIAEAKKSYEKVLERDQYNQIAQKNLLRIQNKNGSPNNGKTSMISPLMFLEEPGKTKIVVCVNPAPAKVVASLSCGQSVTMKVKKHCIEIRDEEGVYLGVLPDDISFKLTKYIEGGNEYSAVIRSTAKNTLTIFIREMSRGTKYFDQPSFIPSSTFIGSGRTDDGNDKPDTTTTGEESDEV